MKDRLLASWRSRSVREQRMLAAAGITTLLVLGWLLLIRPLTVGLDEAKQRHNDAVIALAETRAAVAALRKSAPAQGGAAGPIDVLIGASAAEAGFPISRLERQGPLGATLMIEAVRPQAFFVWVHAMEAKGVAVERLTATTNTDQTLAIQVTFKRKNA